MLECLKYIFNEYILAYSFVKLRCGKKDVSIEVIAKLPSNRQNAASEGKERKRSVVTTLSLSDESIAPRREGGWDESFAITSIIKYIRAKKCHFLK